MGTFAPVGVCVGVDLGGKTFFKKLLDTLANI